MIEIGKSYYFIAHAYHHYVGKVIDASPRWAKVNNCVKIMSDSRGWEAFFREGIQPGATNLQHCPDGTLIPIGNMPIHPWHHPIPKPPPKKRAN